MGYRATAPTYPNIDRNLNPDQFVELPDIVQGAADQIAEESGTARVYPRQKFERGSWDITSGFIDKNPPTRSQGVGPQRLGMSLVPDYDSGEYITTHTRERDFGPDWGTPSVTGPGMGQLTAEGFKDLYPDDYDSGRSAGRARFYGLTHYDQSAVRSPGRWAGR